MPPATRSNPLGAITDRLAGAPQVQLPHLVPGLTNDLTNCRMVLSASANHQGSLQEQGPESTVLVHKYKTQISTLLQDKRVEVRWAAVVLVKATIEVGAWEVLQGAAVWVRSLLEILKKPDPVTTKKLCILTLTRIFLLTHGQQNLTREITTPSLPPFITACLNLITVRVPSQDAKRIDVYASLANPVLQAFIRLLPQHPSAFRPFIAQIKSIIAPLLTPTPSSLSTKELPIKAFESPPQESVVLAQRLFALLPYSAPKNTSGEEWTKTVNTLLAQAHRTANHVFRAIVENRTSSSGHSSGSVDSRTFGQVVSDTPNEQLSLPGWRGIHAGVERLVGLISLLQAHITTTSASAVTIPLGLFGNLIERLMSVIGPLKSISIVNAAYDIQPPINPEISREEREGLWSRLPLIHAAAIDLLSILILRLQGSSIAFLQASMDLILWVFRSNVFEAKIRISAYKAMTQILMLIGPSMSQPIVSSLSPLIQSCCDDILPSDQVLNGSLNSSNRGRSKAQPTNKPTDNVDSYLRPESSSIRHIVPKDVYDAAFTLLPLLLSKVPTEHLSRPIRGQLDRTAILVRQKDAMVASVLNPPHSQDKERKRGTRSILPHLAQACSDAFEVEAILRPRLPVLQTRQYHDKELGMNEDEYSSARDLLENTTGYRRSEELSRNNTELHRDNLNETQGLSAAVRNANGTITSQNTPLQPQDSQLYTLTAPSTLDLTKRHREPNDNQDPDTSTLAAPATQLSESSAPPTKRVKLDDKVFVVHTESGNAPQNDPSVITQEQEPTASTLTDHLAALKTRSDPLKSTSAARLGNADESDSSDGSEIPPLDPTLNPDLFEDDDEYEEAEDEITPVS